MRTTNMTVVIRGTPPQEEAPAGGAILPGDAVEMGTGATTVTAGADVPARPLMVAIEPIWKESATVANINLAYASTDVCYFVYPQPGDKIQMRATASETFAVNSPVVVATTGKITVGADTTVAGVIGRSLTANASTTLNDLITVVIGGV